jgi:hypothetical protein
VEVGVERVRLYLERSEVEGLRRAEVVVGGGGVLSARG